MGRSVLLSGSSGGTNPEALAQAIDRSADIDALLALLVQINKSVANLRLGISPRAPTLQPTIVGAAGLPLTSPVIPAPGPGLAITLKVIAWYDTSGANGRLEINGSDGIQYLNTPIANKSGLSVSEIRLKENIGCNLKMTAGGASISGRLNYALSIESA